MPAFLTVVLIVSGKPKPVVSIRKSPDAVVSRIRNSRPFKSPVASSPIKRMLLYLKSSLETPSGSLIVSVFCEGSYEIELDPRIASLS